jgi:pyocin large subunit-like protein
VISGNIDFIVDEFVNDNEYQVYEEYTEYQEVTTIKYVEFEVTGTEETTATVKTTVDTQTESITTQTNEDITTIEETTVAYKSYTFRNSKLFAQHYEKHGAEMDCNSPEEYLQKANDVINNPNSLHKLEQEDNDEVYYLESTGEFVVVSTDGYIRTYFYASLDYYNRQ